MTWDENGQLIGFKTTRYQGGVVWSGVSVSQTDSRSGPFEVVRQLRWVDGRLRETRTSPPWFTEEEILQSVEGVEE